jgi:putative FmdB family regulatory protein
MNGKSQMPMHDYRCGKCKHEYEVFYTSQSKVETEEPEEKCPQCGSVKKKRLVSKSTSFALKGSGWARDRYGR